jgi:hypothetical protein
MKLVPQRGKVVARLVAMPEAIGLIQAPITESPIRRVEVVAVGPETSVEIGTTYLANTTSGQLFDDDLVLLPNAPGLDAFLAEWTD